MRVNRCQGLRIRVPGVYAREQYPAQAAAGPKAEGSVGRLDRLLKDASGRAGTGRRQLHPFARFFRVTRSLELGFDKPHRLGEGVASVGGTSALGGLLLST